MIYKILIPLIIAGIAIVYRVNLEDTMKVQVGDKLPDFNLINEAGETVKSHDLPLPLVLFFYPKNETAVCTKEACYFRDYFSEFKENGVTVIGVSKDGIKSHQSFKSHHQLPYPLMSDIGGNALKILGATKFLGVVSARVTLVINKEGEIIHIFNSPIQAEQHVMQALQSLGIK